MAAVDEFDLEEASLDGGAHPGQATRRRRAHPAAWLAAGVALICVGAANADAIPAMVRMNSGTETGLLGVDARDAPEVLWEVPVTYSSIAAVNDGVVVAMDYDVDESAVGIDFTTGEELWRYGMPGSTACQWGEAGVCVEDPGTSEAIIVTIDLQDGTRTAEPYPDAVAALPVADGRVVIEATDGELEEIVLVEPDGRERWRVTADAAEVYADSVWVDVWVTDESLLLRMSGTAIDLESGVAIPHFQWNLTDEIWVTRTDDDDFEVTTPDGTFTLLPEEVWLPWDDDLGGQIAVTQTGVSAIIAVSRSGGETLWRIESPECYLSARLLGSLVTQCWGTEGDRLHAVDQLTGETRWELQGAHAVGAASHALLASADAGRTLLGVDPLTGEVLWSIDLSGPLGMQATPLSDGALVATDLAVLRLMWR